MNKKNGLSKCRQRKLIEAFCADLMASAPFMLSMEMRDIDPELSPKASSIRDYLPEDLA